MSEEMDDPKVEEPSQKGSRLQKRMSSRRMGVLAQLPAGYTPSYFNVGATDPTAAQPGVFAGAAPDDAAHAQIATEASAAALAAGGSPARPARRPQRAGLRAHERTGSTGDLFLEKVHQHEAEEAEMNQQHHLHVRGEAIAETVVLRKLSSDEHHQWQW